MVTPFNYKKYSSTPSPEEALPFKSQLMYRELSPAQQETLKRDLADTILRDVHQKVKALRTEITNTIGTSGAGEIPYLVHLLDQIRHLDNFIQGRRMK